MRTLDYAEPSNNARLRRYGIRAIAGGLASGIFLAGIWICVLKTAIRHRAGWSAHLNDSICAIIFEGLLFGPCLGSLFLCVRAKKRLLADQLAAAKAEAMRLEDELKHGIWWRVPKTIVVAEWPAVGCMAAVTYIVILVIGSIIQLLPTATHADKDISAIHVAFVCANVVGAMMVGFYVLVLLLPGYRITLTAGGIHQGMVSARNVLPYSSIRRVYIANSRSWPELQRLAIFAADARGGQQWHYCHFAPVAPVAEIIKVFESKGLSVEMGEPLNPAEMETRIVDARPDSTASGICQIEADRGDR